MNINTDYAQYQALAEHDQRLQEVLNGITPSVKHESENKALEELQKADLLNDKSHGFNPAPCVDHCIDPNKTLGEQVN